MIYDLSYGIRLPNPAFCPQSITTIIESCFYESPESRPDFEEIKHCLTDAYNKIPSQLQSKGCTTGNNIQPISNIAANPMKHNTMKTRYNSLLQENKKQMEKKLIHARKTSVPGREGQPFPAISYVMVESETN